MALTGLLKQTRGEKNTQQALCPCLARNARRKTTLLPCQDIMYWDPLFQNVGVLSKSYCKVRERKVSEVETATNFGWGLAQRSSDVSGISEYVQNWETIPDIIQRIFSPDKSHWKEKTVCICTCETSWETQCRRSVMQQVCWSKSGTNNRARLSSPPASCMRGIWRETTALVSAAQLAVKGGGARESIQAFQLHTRSRHSNIIIPAHRDLPALSHQTWWVGARAGVRRGKQTVWVSLLITIAA